MENIVCIVVPVYNTMMNEYEKMSLKQCVRVLSDYPLIFVAPEDMDTSQYTALSSGLPSVVVEKFDRLFFLDGIAGYNRLMLSREFYSRFVNYDYILIYQLDSFVFSDRLTDWCRKGYDYIGAPWLQTPWHDSEFFLLFNRLLQNQSFVMRQLTKLKWRSRGMAGSVAVGNGGLSLRRVDLFVEASTYFEREIVEWTLNEDIFWSVYLPLMSYPIRIPRWQQAVWFAFDYKPMLSYDLTEQNLPFGCHGWYRDDCVYKDNLKFWSPIISKIVGELPG